MPRRVLRAAVLALTAALLAVSAAPAVAARSHYVRLSNERTHTLSSEVLRPVWVRSSAGGHGRRLARLHTATYAGSPDVVIMLGIRSVRGRTWSYVRYPGLGSRRGWVPVDALSSPAGTSKRLVIDRAHLRIRLFRGRRLLFSAPVGIGAVGSPTPRGHFYIRERLGPFRNSNSIYGAIAFGTSAYSPYRTDWPGGGQVGIHGTNQPSLVPGRISNGCVRLVNSDVRRLARLLSVGTPLLIK